MKNEKVIILMNLYEYETLGKNGQHGFKCVADCLRDNPSEDFLELVRDGYIYYCEKSIPLSEDLSKLDRYKDGVYIINDKVKSKKTHILTKKGYKFVENIQNK